MSFFSDLRYGCDGCGTRDLHDGCGARDLHDGCGARDLRDGCGARDLRDGCGARDLRDGCGACAARDFGAASLPALAPEDPARINYQFYPSNPRFHAVFEIFPKQPMLAPLLIVALTAVAQTCFLGSNAHQEFGQKDYPPISNFDSLSLVASPSPYLRLCPCWECFGAARLFHSKYSAYVIPIYRIFP